MRDSARRPDAHTGTYSPPSVGTVQAFEDISAAAVTGAHTAGVRKFLTICSHSGDAVQTALNAKAGLGAGKVIKGSKGAARVVEWPDGTLLAVPETHLSMDAYWRTNKAAAVQNSKTAVEMFKVLLLVM